MTDPVIVGGVVLVGGVLAAAAYSYLSGNESSVDLDSDGDAEVEFGGDGGAGGETKNLSAEGTIEADTLVGQSEDEGDEGASLEDLYATELQQVTGVGPSTADSLNEIGVASADDLANASVETLTEVEGIAESRAKTLRANATDAIAEDSE